MILINTRDQFSMLLINILNVSDTIKLPNIHSLVKPFVNWDPLNGQLRTSYLNQHFIARNIVQIAFSA